MTLIYDEREQRRWELVVYHKKYDIILIAYMTKEETVYNPRNDLVKTISTYKLYHPDYNILTYLEFRNNKLSNGNNFIILGEL